MVNFTITGCTAESTFTFASGHHGNGDGRQRSGTLGQPMVLYYALAHCWWLAATNCYSG